ncbi:MAG: protein translocase subunit SecF, partial [Acidobacteria bacterium]|nr:protein translocase subunit SecF [Acidobacteriota bacterium]
IREVLAESSTSSAVKEGKIDLNNTTSASISELLSQAITSGEIGGSLDQCKNIADSIMEVKKNNKGILSDFNQLKQSPLVNDNIVSLLQKKTVIGNFSILRIDTVGPTIGKELKEKSALLVFWSLLAILVYAWFRFKLRFSIGAIASLIHDAIISIGFMSIFGVEVNIPAIVFLLTLIGSSINATIVLFDRVREHMKNQRRDEDKELFDQSINEVFSRTIITSFLTFVVVAAMLIYGGEAIHSFAFVMTWGIVVGTYSSIFIASPLVLWWNKLGIEKLFAKKRR